MMAFYSPLREIRSAQVLGDQLLRSGSSVGAHFREALRAQFSAVFISKIEGGMRELMATASWLELLEGGRFCERDQLERGTEERRAFVSTFSEFRKRGSVIRVLLGRGPHFDVLRIIKT